MKGLRQWKWHLDEMYVKINCEMHYLLRAVDQEATSCVAALVRSCLPHARSQNAATRSSTQKLATPPIA